MQREELITELWRRFKHEGDSQARAFLITEYSPWARRVAAEVQRRVARGIVEWSDHVQNAHLGLLEAIERYDPQRGIPFEPYARRRVRGAVFNGLRHVQRSHRLDIEPLQREETSNSAISVFVSTILETATEYLIEQAVDASPEGRYESSQFQRILAEALLEMPKRTRDIFIDHYYLHKPFVQIAAELKLTKGRVSQLHSGGLRLIREHLTRDGMATTDFW